MEKTKTYKQTGFLAIGALAFALSVIAGPVAEARNYSVTILDYYGQRGVD